MKKLILLFLLFSIKSTFSSTVMNQNKAAALEQELEKSELKSLKSIKEVIENDNLSKHVLIKKKKEQAKEVKEKSAELARYDIPKRGEVFTFLSELWLIKNITVLKWDFKKVNYGINSYFKNFLEKTGILNLRYKILLIDTPMVTHFALPTNKSEAILLLSLPFIRTLDLSKLEISLILLEDLLRMEEGYFKSHIIDEKFQKVLGSNFHKKTFDKEMIAEVHKKYDKLIYENGFNFKQQFKITKKMDRLLKGNLKLWNKYYLLIQKIKELSDTNYLYKHHVKIYPSPELQLNWLKPTK